MTAPWLRRFARRFLQASSRGRKTHAGRPLVELLEPRNLLATFTVLNTGDNGGVNPAPGAGTGTLRQAIIDSNNAGGSNSITFNVGGGGAQTIALSAALPIVTATLQIQGNTQPGYVLAPLVVVNGGGASVTANGFVVTANTSSITALTINGFGGSGIEVSGATSFIAFRNYIGTNAAGTAALANGGDGILLDSGASSATIDSNVISGNTGNGVNLTGVGTTNNVVLRNTIGLGADGSTVVANGNDGVLLQNGASNNFIGDPSSHNVISGNATNGVEVKQVIGVTTANLVEGDYIGTDSTGTLARGNGTAGVFLNNVQGNQVGGPGGEANLISGNGTAFGVEISNNAGGNSVLDNLIGTDVNGTAALGNNVGVSVSGGSKNNTVSGNVISASVSDGVQISSPNAAGNVFSGNFIGTNAAGTAALGNGGDGVNLASQANTIGGTTPGAGNVISGNKGDAGVLVAGTGGGFGGNLVAGNIIGADKTGLVALGNTNDGIDVQSLSNIIGGTTAAARNVIVASGNAGIAFQGGLTANNLVQGNYVGVGSDGATGLGNTNAGIDVFSDFGGETIGGTAAGAGNVVSGNGAQGVRLLTRNNLVQGNFIGTNAAGTAPRGNGSAGVYVAGAGDTIGGSTAAARNVISGNGSVGVLLFTGSSQAIVLGNFIGTNAAGTAALGNGGGGVQILTANNVIGGTAAGAGNVISGNGSKGIYVATPAATGNQVLGNLIGTNAGGTGALGNVAAGVYLDALSAGNFIGVTSTGTVAGNVIAASGTSNLVIDQSSSGNTVEGNFIGTDRTGTYKLGNASAQAGVLIISGSQNLIGDVAAGKGNVIAFSGGPAVQVSAGSDNSIRGNSLFLNAGPGILLGDGATKQSAPVIAGFVGGNVPSINYTVPATAGAAYPLAVDFYIRDPATPFTSAEGKTFVGSDSYSTPGVLQQFEGVIPIPAGSQVVATATDAVGNTSTFSVAALLNGSVYEWTGQGQAGNDADPSWTNPGNWQLLAGAGHAANYPHAENDVAVFDQTTPQTTPTIPDGANVLVGEIDFSATSSYTVQAVGTGNLTFATSFGNARINDTSPASLQTISAPITLDTSLDVSNASSAALTLSGLLTETPSTVLTNVNGGPLALTGTLAVPAGQTLTLNNPTPASTTTYTAAASLNNGATLLVTTAAGSTATYSGTISGAAGNLTKQGPGKLILPATAGNSYTGTTVVLNGELEVDDNQPNSPVYVTSTGLLTGQGVVGAITTGTAPADPPAIQPDLPPTLTLGVNSVTLPANPTGPTPFVFTVTLSAASTQVVTVNYATSPAPAATLPPGVQPAPTSDFDVTSGTITFPAGQTAANVQISAYGNSLNAPEAFQIVLSNPAGAQIGQGVGLGTINPPLPTLAVGGAAVAADPSGTTNLSFPVSLSAAINQPVTVNYTLASYPTAPTYPLPTLGTTITPGSVSAFTAVTSGQLTIPANSNGTTLTIPAAVSPNLTSPQAFTLILSNPSNAVLPAGTSQAAGLVMPANTPSVSVSPAAGLASRTGTATITFTVSLSAPLASPLTVNWKTVDPTLSFFASGGPVQAKSVTTIRGQTTDYRGVNNGSVTFAAGATQQTFSVVVNSSINFVQFGKYFQVQLSLPSGTTAATIGVGTALGTILYPTAQQTDGIQPDPNNFPAVLTSAGSVTLDPSAFLNILIDGPTLGTGTGFTGYSQLNVTAGNTVNLGGAQLNVFLNNPAYVPAAGTQFTIVNNQGNGPVLNTFAGLTEGAVFSVNNTFFQITYQGGDGNDVVLTVVPPAVTIAGPLNGTVNQPVSFDLSGLASGNYVVNWGDGSAPQNVNSGAQSVPHTYLTSGPFNIQVWSVVNGVNGVVTTYQTTIAPVTVSGESARWGTAGNVALQTATDGVRLLPAGRNTDLPWVKINRIAITLSSAPPALNPGDVTVVGIKGGNYGPVTISGAGTSYVIQLAKPIAAADRVTITIGNAAIATFTGRLDVLPGDVNDDGVVNISDGGLIISNYTPQHAYQAIYDLNGDGVVNASDFTTERTFNGTMLPTLPPQLAAGGEGPGGASVLTPGELAPVLADAVGLWAAAGLPAPEVARLHAVTAQVADLPAGYLGGAWIGGSTISLSADGAGYGWSLDPTTTPFPGREDLLTVVLHELGHTLGLDDLDPSLFPADLMAQTLATGVRRLPSPGDVAAVLAADAVFATPRPEVPAAPPPSFAQARTAPASPAIVAVIALPVPAAADGATALPSVSGITTMTSAVVAPVTTSDPGDRVPYLTGTRWATHDRRRSQEEPLTDDFDGAA